MTLNDIPEDFPRESTGAVAGAQPKVLVNKEDGRFVDDAGSLRAERYATCVDLREQLVDYVNKKLRESPQRPDGLVHNVIASVQGKRFGWGLSPAEASWVCGQLAKHFDVADKPAA
jgi:hypothetical protein